MSSCYWKDGSIYFTDSWLAVETTGFPQVDLEEDTFQEFKTGMNRVSDSCWVHIPPDQLPEEFRAVLKLRGIKFTTQTLRPESSQ